MKTKILNFAKKHHFILLLMRKIIIFINRVKYLPHYIFERVDSKTVLFETYMGRQYSCSPKAIYLEKLKDDTFKDYSFVWAFKNPEEFEFLKKNRNTTLIKCGGKEYFKNFAKAKFWIVNSRINEAIMKKKQSGLCSVLARYTA